MYILDTDICIALLKGNKQVVEKITSLPTNVEIYMTIVLMWEKYSSYVKIFLEAKYEKKFYSAY